MPAGIVQLSRYARKAGNSLTNVAQNASDSICVFVGCVLRH